MNDGMWRKFFELLDLIVEGEKGDTWQDKMERAKEKAEENGSTTSLEEFVGWFAE